VPQSIQIHVPESLHTYEDEDILSPIHIQHDSYLPMSTQQYEVALSVKHGRLSLSTNIFSSILRPWDVVAGPVLASAKLTLSGSLLDINRQLSHVFYYSTSASQDLKGSALDCSNLAE
jgi:hypothetical protein